MLGAGGHRSAQARSSDGSVGDGGRRLCQRYHIAATQHDT